MAVIEFVENYDDLSTDQGFQFKFHCNHCHNGYMSTFQPNPLAIAGGFLRAAGNMFGGILGSAGNSTYDIQRAIGGPAHDGAVQAAIQEIKPLFIQCRRCGSWVCEKICWNGTKGLCKQCAPILDEEMAAAQAQAGRDQIFSQAAQSNQTAGLDVTVQATATCPHCGAAAGAGKFCSDCGQALQAVKSHCTECGAKINTGVKFCQECGAKV